MFAHTICGGTASLTGQRYLDGYASDDAQYAALMTAGATFAQHYGLRPGIALTPHKVGQMKKLPVRYRTSRQIHLLRERQPDAADL